MRKSSGPVINVRYESQQQVQKFKRAAKACRWSLNTFLLVAAGRYADEVLSSPIPQATTQTPEAIHETTG